MMFEIRKATMEDVPVIRDMASVVFPDTYREILSPEQIDYMMDWMYSEASLRKQMMEEGHIYYLAYHEGRAVAYLSIQPEGESMSFTFKNFMCFPPIRVCVWVNNFSNKLSRLSKNCTQLHACCA